MRKKGHLTTSLADKTESKMVLEALEALPEGLVIYDADDQLVLCNTKFRNIYGYSVEDVRPGVTHQQLGVLDEVRGVKVEDGSDQGFAKDRLQYRSRMKGAQKVRTPDGRLYSTRDRPLKSGGFVSIQIDITELEDTQEKLRKSEQLFLDAIEALDEGFIIYDENDELVVANSTYKQMYPAQAQIEPGITFEDAVRLSVFGGEVPAAIGSEEEWLKTRIEQHNKGGGVSEQTLSDGRWVKVSERRTADGGNVGIRTDITELKDSQSRAEAANRAKTSFLAHMSHELRTPLNSIIGYSDMVRQNTFGPIGDRKYEEYLDNIYNSGALLLSLINDILDISRIEIGEMDAFPERLDPAKVIETCVDMMKPKAAAKRLKLGIRENTFDHALYLDRRHLHQIIINLLSNSIKFTDRGEGVWISMEETDDGGVSLIVADSGCGIADDELEEVFSPFSQVGDAFSRASEGAGLGLYLTKSLVELNDGSVSIESEPDVGTTIRIEFPNNRVVY